MYVLVWLVTCWKLKSCWRISKASEAQNALIMAKVGSTILICGVQLMYGFVNSENWLRNLVLVWSGLLFQVTSMRECISQQVICPQFGERRTRWHWNSGQWPLRSRWHWTVWSHILWNWCEWSFASQVVSSSEWMTKNCYKLSLFKPLTKNDFFFESNQILLWCFLKFWILLASFSI